MPAQGASADLRAVRDAIVRTRSRASGVPDPEVDAELLLGHVLGLSRGGVQARDRGRRRCSTRPSSPPSTRSSPAAPRASRCSTSPGAPRSARSSCASGPACSCRAPRPSMVAQLAIDALRADGRARADRGRPRHAAAARSRSRWRPRCRTRGCSRSRTRPRRSLDARELRRGRRREPRARLRRPRRRPCPSSTAGSPSSISNPPYVPAGEIPRRPRGAPARSRWRRSTAAPTDSTSCACSRGGRPSCCIRAACSSSSTARRSRPPIAAILAADGWRAVAHHRDLTARDRATTALR